MKRILIGILIFLIYLALIIWAAFGLHFEGTKFVLFIVILGLLGALTLAFVLWYLNKLDRASGKSSGPDTPDSINLGNLLRDANAKIRQSNRAGVKSLASLPLIYVIGDENSAKTQTVLQSGLDPELLAGNVYQDGIIVPTQLANLWLAGSYVLVEAGGALLRQPPLWQRLLRATIPARLGSIFGDSRLPARSVVVCVSIERILAPSTSEQIKALAQSLNERLRQLSQTLGISLPIYVLFTKLDTVAPFSDYANKLTDEEVKVPIGSLLSSLSSGSGLYIEQATALIGGRFDQLVYALSEFRLDVLSRGGELKDLARAYEFPRDLRKLRAGIVSFLAEVARPSQIGVNPFLRGFFFAGMRAHIVEDVLEIGPSQPQSVAPVDAGATRIFTLAAMQQQQAAPQTRRGGTRKIAQWVFLPHLFSKILLADKSALETSRASTRTSVLKRTLLVCTSAVFLILLALVTISFLKNRALENRVKEAAAAPVSPVSQGSFASQGDLQSLDNLRAVLAELEGYRKDGRPFMDGFGLYKGDALYPVACQAYSNKFRTLLLGPAQQNIVAKLGLLPPAPTADSLSFSATYNPLKVYLITATNPDPDTAQDTVSYLPTALATEWTGNGTPTPDQARLAQSQFEFYAKLLPGTSSCLAAAGSPRNEALIRRTRTYLDGFNGFDHVYQTMKDEANRKVQSFNFNGKFPGSSTYIVDSHQIPGAFTKDGFAIMQAAFRDPTKYYGGEEWVFGPSHAAPMDPVALSNQLKQTYAADFIQIWQTYLRKAAFVSYKSFQDADNKLGALDSNSSALLELFSLISTNTDVSDSNIKSAFQAPQQVVASTSADGRLIGPLNNGYIQSLGALDGTIKTLNLSSVTDPSAGSQVAQAAVAAEAAATNMRANFVPDPAGGMDKTSFDLLKAPILSAEGLLSGLGAKAAGDAAKDFCAKAGAVLGKFPFNPDSTTDATPDEVFQIFAPGQAFSQFVASPVIKGAVTQQGSQFFKAAGYTSTVNQGFLNFLASAQKIQSTLFASGNQPSLDFTLTEVKSPGIPDATVSVDTQQITKADQKLRFQWVSTPSGHFSLSNPGNSRTSTAPSPWSAFHLAFLATHIPPNRLKFDLETNSQSNATILLDVSGPGAELLNRDFMKGFHCVSQVAH